MDWTLERVNVPRSFVVLSNSEQSVSFHIRGWKTRENETKENRNKTEQTKNKGTSTQEQKYRTENNGTR